MLRTHLQTLTVCADSILWPMRETARVILIGFPSANHQIWNLANTEMLCCTQNFASNSVKSNPFQIESFIPLGKIMLLFFKFLWSLSYTLSYSFFLFYCFFSFQGKHLILLVFKLYKKYDYHRNCRKEKTWGQITQSVKATQHSFCAFSFNIVSYICFREQHIK